MQYGVQMYGDCRTHYICGDSKNTTGNINTKVQKWMSSSAETECPCHAPPCLTTHANGTKKRMKNKSQIPVGSKKSKKSVTFPDTAPGKVLRSVSMIQPCTPNAEFQVHSKQVAKFPLQVTTHVVRMPLVPTSPVRTCSCVSSTIENNENFLPLHNNLQCISTNPLQQVNQRVSNTRFMISGLKTELNKVKSQLNDISVANQKLSRPSSQINMEAEKQLSELKTQNLQLRHELEVKHKECAKSIKDVERAKEILSVYEKKVVGLHDQAMKSSKLIKQSKDEFCRCLKVKESEIKQLKESNDALLHSIREKDQKYKEVNSEYTSLRSSLKEETTKLSALMEESKNFCECIKILETQLDNSRRETEIYQEEVKCLEQQILHFECKICEKLKTKIKKYKSKLNNKLKEYDEKEKAMVCTITQLSNELEVTKQIKSSHENLKLKYNELEVQMKQQEEEIRKYNTFKEKYEQDFETFRQNEENCNKDRQQLRTLVDELTTVIKQNKVTLLQLTAINKHQEELLLSQTSIISEKDEKIKLAESEIDMLRKESLKLQEEISVLQKALSEPCKHECHLQLTEELQNIRNKLEEEIEKRLIKEKIIDDQANTIVKLQQHIKEKMIELNKSKQEIKAAEEEIIGMNEDLMKTQQELEDQYIKKEQLNRRVKELKIQNSNLNVEISQLELLVEGQIGSKNQAVIDSLQQQIKLIQKECETEKLKVCNEKEKAVEAAQFATQKLLDTVNDFQRQVGTQKKVQYLLTKMLHDKEDDLRNVHRRLNSINSLSLNVEEDFPVDEIYKNENLNYSAPNTASSYMSSCSYCSKEFGKCRKPQIIRRQVFNSLAAGLKPIKDFE